MAARWNDWLRQATRDLDQARDSQRAERHEWACFAAHQAAEKAVKALHLRLGQEAWGQVIAQLMTRLGMHRRHGEAGSWVIDDEPLGEGEE